MVWGGGSASRARERHAEGASIVAWSGVDATALGRLGAPARPLEAVIGTEGQAAVTGAARTWTRLWGRVPLVDGDNFRDLVAWRGMSLLWLAEGFLRDETAGPRCAGLAETALRLLDATGAGEVDGVGLATPAATILARACTARGVLFHGPTPAGRPLRPPASRRRSPVAGLFGVFAPRQPPSLPAPAASSGPTRGSTVLVFAGPGHDPSVFHALLKAVETELGHAGSVLRVPELARWETRAARRRASEAEAHLRERFERLRGAPGLHESYTHGGVGFGDLAANDLELLLLVHLPAAVRRLEAAIELVSDARPAAVVVAGASRDERRTLLAACQITETPGIALLDVPSGPDDPDRADGGPRAEATLVWRPGDDVAPVLARLREVARARVEPE